MTDLFLRDYRLQVGDVVITDLDIEFDVKTHLGRKPNTATIRVYNLNTDNRAKLEAEARSIGVELKAGYKSTSVGTIFTGDVSSAVSERAPGGWVTPVEAGDGRRASRTSRVAQSHAAGSRVADIIRGVASSLNIGSGNTERVLSQIAGSTSGPRTVHGNAATQLDRLVSSEGLEWSIQRGNLQFLQRGRALTGSAVVLSPDSGLIGSPSVDKNGLVSCKCNIIPDVFPGRRIKLESASINAEFRVETANYKGSTFGPDWSISLVLKGLES